MAPRSAVDHLDELAIHHSRKDFLRVRVDHTVAQALADVQQQSTEGRIVYFYVVDQNDRLQGILPVRRLLLSPPDAPVAEIMVRHAVALPETATLEDACEQFILHRFLALPIVDAQHRIVGVIDVELYTQEISDLARQDEVEDVFQLIGVRLAEGQRATLPALFRHRFPWLLCNLAGGLACAVLASVFEGVLQRAIVLSLFIPIVLAVAESVSIQALTLALQARHRNRFRWGETWHALQHEVPLGLLLGGACGGIVAAVVLVWLGMALVALSILLSMLLAVTTAVVLALLVPTILHTTRRDPKVASGPIVLAITDLATLFYYLGLATLLIR